MSSRTPSPFQPETALSHNRDAKTPSSDAPSITELISESIPRFDHHTLVVQPYEEEAQREQEFQRKLMELSVDLMLKFAAWASRPVQENAAQAQTFENRINRVMQAEKNQGMCAPRDAAPEPSLLASLAERIRDNFAQFVQQINAAVQMLLTSST